MKFFSVSFVLFVVVMMISQISSSPMPAPKWKFFKRLERVGQNVRDGLIKAGPAIAVLTDIKGLTKG